MPPSGQYNVFELSTATALSLSTSGAGGVVSLSTTQAQITNGQAPPGYAQATDSLLFVTDGASGNLVAIRGGVRDAETLQNLLGAVQYVSNGASGDRVRTPNTFKTFSTVASSSAVAVWTPTAGKRFRLMGFMVGTSTLGDVIFQDSTSAASATPTTIFRVPGGANITPSPVVSPPFGNGILSASTNNLLTITPPTTTGTLSGTVWGTEE